MTTTGARIRRLHLTNYRSVASCDLELGDLAVLVGPNGAGKSNILDALVFLKDSLRTGFEEAIDERVGEQIAFRSSGAPQAPGVAVKVEIDGLLKGQACDYEVAFTVTPTLEEVRTVRSERCVVRSADGVVTASYDMSAGAAEVDGTSIPVPAIESTSLVLGSMAGYEQFAAVRKALVSTVRSAPYPESERLVDRHRATGELRADAGNLPAVLLRLEQELPRAKERIDEYLRLIVPQVTRTRPSVVGGFYTLGFEHEARVGDSYALLAGVMSDGTLRALGILTALFAPSGDGTFGPVIVEEPETALHPAAAGALFDAIREASTMRQVLVTTHSGDLLDAGDLKASEIFAVRSETGSTRVGPLDAGGTLALEKSLFSAGELLRADQLQPAPETRS